MMTKFILGKKSDFFSFFFKKIAFSFFLALLGSRWVTRTEKPDQCFVAGQAFFVVIIIEFR